MTVSLPTFEQTDLTPDPASLCRFEHQAIHQPFSSSLCLESCLDNCFVMVQLILEGDWTSICHGWSQFEQRKRCRRVCLNSYQTNGIVKASVLGQQAVSCISYINCLASPDFLRHYFIGSDALNALESILQVSLTVDEKKALRNKFERHECRVIRRNQDYDNLNEVFDCNQEVKPRNMQKGVRMYNWDKLSAFMVDLASRIAPPTGHFDHYQSHIAPLYQPIAVSHPDQSSSASHLLPQWNLNNGYSTSVTHHNDNISAGTIDEVGYMRNNDQHGSMMCDFGPVNFMTLNATPLSTETLDVVQSDDYQSYWERSVSYNNSF